MHHTDKRVSVARDTLTMCQVGTPVASGVAMKKSFALFALLAACAPAEDKPSVDDGDRPETNCTPVEPGIPTDAALDVADASNAFAVDMYDTVASTASAQQNLFFSPFSISSALGMTLVGAEGETEAQMRSVFHFGDDEAAHHQGYGELSQVVFAKSIDCAATVKMANRLFGQAGYPWRTDFLDTTGLDYDAELEERDFQVDPERERVYINDWVAEQTEDRIQDLLPLGAISAATRLVLANAIYFNADWDSPFEEDRTADSTFTRADGSQVTTPIMYQELDSRVAFAEGIMAVELEYDGGTQSMVLMMPENPSEDFAPASAFDTGILTAIEDSLDYSGEVFVGLPRFSFSQETDLKAALQNLGMVDAFVDGTADFTGMADMSATGESLYIGGAYHKAFIAVDEAGTEAAAATAVVMDTESAPMLTFIADRTFEFYIRDNATGTILFMGRVSDPTAE